MEESNKNRYLTCSPCSYVDRLRFLANNQGVFLLPFTSAVALQGILAWMFSNQKILKRSSL